MSCRRCGSDSAFQVFDGDQASGLCATCLDRIYPDLKLASLTQAMVRKREAGACPYCGWTVQKAKDAGLIGCPLCYESLDSSLWSEFGIHLVAG